MKYPIWDLLSSRRLLYNLQFRRFLWYIRARIPETCIGEHETLASAFCQAHVAASGTNGMCTGRVAKGTSYSREEKCRRLSRFSCPLGKSDTKSIHVYLRTCGVTRYSAEHVTRKADRTLPTYLQLLSLLSVCPRFRSVCDMTSINFVERDYTLVHIFWTCWSKWSLNRCIA